MTGKDLAQELKQIVEDLRGQGTVAINSDRLIAYLDEVIKSPDIDPTAAELERYRAQLMAWVEQHRGFYAANLEMFKSVIQAGQNALRTSFLMNGGATVALLAFIGKLSDQHPDKILIFASSMRTFVFGVLAITLSSGCVYVAQAFYARQKNTLGHWGNSFSILLALTSYGFFIWGVFQTYSAFIKFAS